MMHLFRRIVGQLTRTTHHRVLLLLLLGWGLFSWGQLHARVRDDGELPNILLAIADDWGWPHAGAYGDRVVKTPVFDRLAQEGALFHHAYVSSPSCTPSRGAILTGQWHWRLDGAANLWSVFPDRLATYAELLEQNGYHVGHSSKAWGPGKCETPGRLLTGKRYRSFQEFLEQRPENKPFCFWLGTLDPHRPYEKGSGAASGIDLAKIDLPGCFPEHLEIRADVADYYFEVQRFDRLVGSAIESLEARGELEKTLVVMTGDHGMPFPRCKSNLYDSGTRVPLAAKWPKRFQPGLQVEDFVSLTDLAPTFLGAAGIALPEGMTGRSLLGLASSGEATLADPRRDHVLIGKERHVPAQESPDMGGYPGRAIRTHDYLYIRNFHPERWPNGTPHYRLAAIPGSWYGDTDNGPTKTFMIANRDKGPEYQRHYNRAFAKRPAEELYDLDKDPDQLRNVADDREYQEVKRRLADRLMARLAETGDPRATGVGDFFDEYPYLGGSPKHPDWEEEANSGEQK